MPAWKMHHGISVYGMDFSSVARGHFCHACVALGGNGWLSKSPDLVWD